MKNIIISLLKYYIFWIFYFLLFKVFFLLFNFSQTKLLGWEDLVGIFFHGIRMDLSSAGYLTILPGILFALTSFIKPQIIRNIISGYTFLILIAITFLGILDTILYPSWGTRLNAQILPYLANPKGMIDCVSIWELIAIMAFQVVIVTTSIWLFSRFISRKLKSTKKPSWIIIPLLLLMTGSLILPIRGGTGTSPLNFSSVYFSQNLFANHSAYNFFWSFNYGLTHNEMKENPLKYFQEELCKKNIDGIYLLNQEKPQVVINRKNSKPVNVVLIILESFSNNIIGKLDGKTGFTPNFDKLCEEGVLFSDFYATGNRSDKGLSSLLGSYPALIKSNTILHDPEKMEKIKFLPELFKDWGYDLSFHYGGDIEFFNTSLMLIQSGVNKITSDKDFPGKISGMQKWGVPDEYLFDRFESDLKEIKEPFFSVAYTLSSHEPFDVPNFNRLSLNTVENRFKNSVAYADSCLGRFITDLKVSKIWDNTLVIITADHASLYVANTTYEDLSAYRIPMLWIGGAIDTSFVCNNISMQTDLSSTLAQQLGYKVEPSWFSKNIFGSKQYAFYFTTEGWGFVSPETAFYQNIESGNRRYFKNEICPAKDSLDIFSKSFVQFLHKDFIEK